VRYSLSSVVLISLKHCVNILIGSMFRPINHLRFTELTKYFHRSNCSRRISYPSKLNPVRPTVVKQVILFLCTVYVIAYDATTDEMGLTCDNVLVRF